MPAMTGKHLPTLSWAQMRTAGTCDDAGFCRHCHAAYCCRHWHVTRSGNGQCPEGHGKSPDQHRTPEDSGT